MSEARKLLTIAEFCGLPEEVRGRRSHLIDGQIVRKAAPGGEHGEAEFTLATALAPFRRPRRSDGTGGWWFKIEASVSYPRAERIITHDIVGWRRDRVPTSPTGFPIRERPDWACEVAVTSLKWDTRDMPVFLAEAGVPHYWVLDPINGNLRVFETKDAKLVETLNLFREDGLLRIPPFEAVELGVGILLGDEDPSAGG